MEEQTHIQFSTYLEKENFTLTVTLIKQTYLNDLLEIYLKKLNGEKFCDTFTDIQINVITKGNR